MLVPVGGNGAVESFCKFIKYGAWERTRFSNPARTQAQTLCVMPLGQSRQSIRMRHLLRLFIFLTICHFTASGQEQNQTVLKLDEYLKSANKAYRFNGVALVIHNDEVVLNKGYGFSNMDSKTLNSPATRFPILSITKSFTSTIILKLQDEKKISVNDKLSKYFPDYPNGSKIAIHHLLTHSSGIYNYTGDVGIVDSAIVNNPI